MKQKGQSGNGMKFIGREVQLADLKRVFNSDCPEFVAVYGRRRVGKTFIIREAAGNNFAFYYTAANNTSKNDQLTNFTLVLRNYFPNGDFTNFHNWFEAFNALAGCMDSLPHEKNKIIFFDEMPWADSPKSGFLAAFENFWNMHCAFRPDIKVVVCGSATSWILNKIIHNIGGLYGRLTHIFKIEPFNLYETEQYFKAYGFRFSQMQIAEIYMVLGGIPFYFSLFDKAQSIAQNFDRLFFSQNAPLRKEFNILYASLYRNPSLYIEVINALSKKGKGMTRQEILDLIKKKSNGSFTKVLKELEEGGFIRAYHPFENKRLAKTTSKKNIIYQLVDLFSLFYLKFCKESNYNNENFWTSNYAASTLNVWRGIAFETLGLWHIPQIKSALGISGVSARICAWTGENEEKEKAQIDMLIDRDDNMINICEMKWCKDDFSITKKYCSEINGKVEIFLEATKTRKVPVVTLITTNGLKLNSYRDSVQKVIILSQLFKY